MDASTGQRLAAYPEGVLAELRQRFADAMLDGVKTYSEAEKQALREHEAPELTGPPFGAARLVGRQLAFGTEEGWAYLFDATTLRPCARYRAGAAAASLSRAADGRVLAAAGEEIYALQPATGAVAWQRTVGAEPSWAVAGDTLGVVAGGRLHTVRTTDGSLGWTLRGGFRSVSADATGSPWLVDDGEGHWRVVVPPGRLAGEALSIAGEPLPPAATGNASWVVATKEGTLRGVGWSSAAAEGRLETRWERTWGEPLVAVQAAGERVLVRGASGTLTAFDPAAQSERWRLPLGPEVRVRALPQAGVLLALAADGVRVHDWTSGEKKAERRLAAPALAADLRDDVLAWIDALGQVHLADPGPGEPRTSDLGLLLVEALPVEEGFLVRTAAGEVGLVEVSFKREG